MRLFSIDTESYYKSLWLGTVILITWRRKFMSWIPCDFHVAFYFTDRIEEHTP